MAQQIDELARRSQNFGFLAPHEPLLVLDGAGAETYVYSDPDAALFKARRFGETLAKKLVALTQTRVDGTTQHARLQALTNAGVLLPRIRQAFDEVRNSGNRAVHTHFGDVRVALSTVGTCFELGLWFHRAITGDREPRAFVPPAEPEADGAAVTTIEQAELEQLRSELSRYRQRLAEIKLRRDDQATQLEAEARARLAAEQALAQAKADRDQLQVLVEQMNARLAEVEAKFLLELATPPKVSAAKRDAFIESAQRAAREPLTEAEVRAEVDAMLTAAGWVIQDAKAPNVFAGDGIAVREVRTASGPADYLLYVDRKLVGVIEAKREGQILSPVEAQSARYATSLTASQQLQAWRLPLPFRYETTAAETHFTNMLDPAPRAREVFWFHRPETLARWMREADADESAPTLRARLRRLPPLDERGLRPAQIDAVKGLERSLAQDQPRSLIQMATGAGKTYTVVAESYRLLNYANANRILFLVDRNNLGIQAKTEFDNYVTPDDGRKFTELFNVERLSGAGMLASTKVVVSTIQRLHAMLRGQSVDPDLEDPDLDSYDIDEVAEVGYNPGVPPETFDLIVVDECHRSIYGKWRRVLEYFDAHLVGLTATPIKQTFGFFHQNLVSEYTYAQSVTDNVNVDFEVYRIRTKQTEQGDTIEAGTVVPKRDRRTRRQRYEELDDDLAYNAGQVGKDVISKGQLRLVLETFRGRLFTEIFPGRRYVPKTLIFARDDNHAEEIVQMTRLVFGQSNDFCAKITYSARDPQKLLAAFRNSPELRIAVTVDMIATGTDVRPLECVFFLRDVKSWAYFEQMKGRGARTLDPAELAQVTPDAQVKDRFVIVDAIGVTESPRVDASPLQQHSEKQISLEQLLRKAGTLTLSPEETGTLASRLAKLNLQITPDERAELEQLAGQPLTAVVTSLRRATDPDELERAESRGRQGVRELVEEAVRPLAANPELRNRLLEIRRAHDIVYDEINPDELIEAQGVDPKKRAQETVTSWRNFIEEHRDEITAIEIAYRHGGGRGVYRQLKELAARIGRPPHAWTPERLWREYERLELTARRPGLSYGPVDLIGLIRYELGLDVEPRPHRSAVEERFAAWLLKQEQAGVTFTVDQTWWLERIRDVVATSAAFEHTDLDQVPFTERGGTDGFLHTFGDDHAEAILTDLHRDLTA
ncbi:DEAD/DEAH box helicase family protein [Micromonospora sp. WMMD558]|uniref:DEAD/DEAH box helicase family protein n=1 Tax=Micromonospora sp. WMMD558 TaxID=3403462 RepID=UPI003BF4A69F